MSRIDGRTDVARDLQVLYEKKEKDLTGRHREEITELRETHHDEIERLNAEHEKVLDRVRHESDDKLTAKDVQYQKEIEALRAMQAKRLRESNS